MTLPPKNIIIAAMAQDDNSELKQLSKLMRKLCDYGIEFYGKKIVVFDIKQGNIVGAVETESHKSIDLSILRQQNL